MVGSAVVRVAASRAARTSSRIRARSPVARASTDVRNREYPHLLGGNHVGDPVGKAGDSELADQQADRHTRNSDPSIGPRRKLLDGPVDRCEERQPETRPLGLSPECGLLKLSRRFRFEEDLSDHPSVSARPTRSRTKDQSSPDV